MKSSISNFPVNVTDVRNVLWIFQIVILTISFNEHNTKKISEFRFKSAVLNLWQKWIKQFANISKLSCVVQSQSTVSGKNSGKTDFSSIVIWVIWKISSQASNIIINYVIFPYNCILLLGKIQIFFSIVYLR